MSRRRAAIVRELLPDVKYGSVMVTKFINSMMWGGKKSTAERLFYSALESAAGKLKQDPLELFDSVIEAVRPRVEVRSRRVGGATYQVPIDVRGRRASTLPVRWIIAAARARKGRSFDEKLAAELMDAAKGTGAAVKKKEDTHRMADANKAYAHLRI